jgi:hypothetical protein
VEFVLREEIAAGRVESDGNSRVRLRPGALSRDVIAALRVL